MSEGKVKQLALKNVTVDPKCQSRADGLDEATVAEYVEALAGGAEFPPLVVYHDTAGTNWLSEGFHRFEAYTRHGAKAVPVEMRPGNREAAILNSVGSNAAHGLKRTNKDKRHCVALVLELHPDWTSGRIAEAVGVSNRFVEDIREPSVVNGSQLTRVGKDGKKYPAKKKPKSGQLSSDDSSPPAPSDATSAQESKPDDVTSEASTNAPAENAAPESAGDPFAVPGKEADPEDPPLDGRFMPNADEARGFAAKFRSWVHRMRAVRTEMRQALDRAHVLHKRIDGGDFDAKLGELIETLDINVPGHACPPCCGTGTEDGARCKYCDGYGVVDSHHHAGLKARWKRTSARHAELVAAAERGAA
jgi:hypothetical protein